MAAAKYMEEQARIKADKEEKMTKFRDSASDAAARTLQQMYYVFSVSRIHVRSSSCLSALTWLRLPAGILYPAGRSLRSGRDPS